MNLYYSDPRCSSGGGGGSSSVSAGSKRSQENRRLEEEAKALQARNQSYALVQSDDEELQVRPSKHKKSKKEKKSKRDRAASKQDK